MYDDSFYLDSHEIDNREYYHEEGVLLTVFISDLFYYTIHKPQYTITLLYMHNTW